MATVQTVTGPVDGADLGRTLVHEHIRISYYGEELDPTYSWDRAETVARAVDKMGELLDAGFRTFVDPCPIELGRDPELYAEISSRSGMRIVCTTGFYTEHMGSGLPFYWRAREPEEIAELYVHELTEGIAGTDGIRAGAIKAATGVEVTPAESRCLTGAARAQHEVGCAIITHTENSRHGDVQQDLFADGGADLGRVLIGHQDEQTDVAPIRKLAERGTFVGVDRIGLEILAPDDRRADHVATLVREGFTEQVCLSQDHICALTAPRPSFYVPPEHRAAAAQRREAIAWQVWQRPYTYILTDFVPRLRERGVTEADVETIFVDNPRRLLAGA
jgi:phosphotriesterase-related protein